ncbi:hypothetical protein INF26_02220 [Olsenella sp. DSM 107455]|uniref:PIN domain-containing protein n=1 Tax=Thermophilibacter gallinarum TaxID=2779357 RepID=A0ABR9QRH4_9ACTN|nr:hypothetical protein [Thermophilibacter gallinarum]MBE5023671.1 hypothetical protein [Thermophilibacter gallinarum]
MEALLDANAVLCYLLDEVTCRRKNVAAAALGLYSGGSLDFVDCVLAAERQELGRDVVTFDKRFVVLLGKVGELFSAKTLFTPRG